MENKVPYDIAIARQKDTATVSDDL